jgi:hypothetical protein
MMNTLGGKTIVSKMDHHRIIGNEHPRGGSGVYIDKV